MGRFGAKTDPGWDIFFGFKSGAGWDAFFLGGTEGRGWKEGAGILGRREGLLVGKQALGVGELHEMKFRHNSIALFQTNDGHMSHRSLPFFW